MKIYLDCTHTYNSGLNTGIQRVVKSIVKNIYVLKAELNLEIIPVISVSDRYYKFDTFPQTQPKDRLGLFLHKSKNRLKAILKNIYEQTRVFLEHILPEKLHNFLFSSRNAVLLNKITDKVLFSKKPVTKNLVVIESGDMLLLVDSTWLNTNYKQLDDLKKINVKIVALIYDIIPITHPQFCSIYLVSMLKDWYINATKYIDGYIAISKTVKNDVYNYIKENIDNQISEKKFDFFYLGADFEALQRFTGVSESFKNLFKVPNIYLSVSTIEPRKNHTYILDAFDILWDNGEDITYIMIGKIGSQVEDLLQRIKTHPMNNKKLFLLTDIDDESLIYAYQNSKSLIFASIVEGFGLPLVESLFYKLPVLASDIPIHREIGKDMITYFDLCDKNSLVQIIKAQVNKEKCLSGFNWQSWYQSTKDLILKCKEI